MGNRSQESSTTRTATTSLEGAEPLASVTLSDELQTVEPIGSCSQVEGDEVRPLPSPPRRLPPIPSPSVPQEPVPAPEDSDSSAAIPQMAVSPSSDSSIPSPSKAQVMFQSRLKASDANASLEISTAPQQQLKSGLPPTPPTLTPDNLDTPGSSTSTLLGDEQEGKDLDGPFFFKPVINSRRASEEIPNGKLALKQALKLQIPASAGHSLSHKRNAPSGLPLMQPTPSPVHPRQRRRSLPASPFVLFSDVEGFTDSPCMETPDHLLFSGLDSGLMTQRMLDTPLDPFPATPASALESALFQPVPIKMMENLDDDDGYISDPGSAVARYFVEPEKAGPKIQRGKQLPFPVRPTKAVPMSLLQTGSNPVALRESRHARLATLKRRYHEIPSQYGLESPVRSPVVRSPIRSPVVVRVGRASIFDALGRVGVSSPLAQRPMQGFA